LPAAYHIKPWLAPGLFVFGAGSRRPGHRGAAWRFPGLGPACDTEQRVVARIGHPRVVCLEARQKAVLPIVDPQVNPFRMSFRAQCLLAFAACAGLLAIALTLQLKGGLVPCPLCIFQRIAFTATGAVFLVAGLHAPRAAWGQRLYAALALLAAGIGVGIAGRHVWLQHLPPDEVPSCGPGLDYMRELLPMTSVIRKVLTGSGECARVDWTLMGLSMAEWGLLWFMVLACWALWLLLRRRRPAA
jgi:disulfide bond formation protein DsbB